MCCARRPASKSDGKQQAAKTPSVETARFQMEGPGDLLPKLSHDLKRLTRSQTRGEAAYAAFDFAVTAWSVIDWSWLALKKRNTKLTKPILRDVILKNIPDLEVCRLIANGAKHFVVSDRPREIETLVVSMRSKTADPSGNGQVLSTHEALALVHWNGETYACDSLFADIYVKLAQFLRTHHLDTKGHYLSAPFDYSE